MSTTSHNNRSPPIDAAWFATLREKYSRSNGNNETLGRLVTEEISILQTFYDHRASAEDSAYQITRPISTTPIPTLGTYSDETVALISLWHILVEALVQWPAPRYLDILDMLSAIGKLPKTIQVHKGEATDFEGVHPLTWDWFPYFSLAWEDALREPDEIVRQAQRDPSFRFSQSDYIYRKDIEAQLLARGVLVLNNRTIDYIARTLEETPDKDVAADEAAATQQNRIDFQVPAVASLLRHCGPDIFRLVHTSEDPQQWDRWSKRLGEILDSDTDGDGPTRAAARSALAEMQAIRG